MVRTIEDLIASKVISFHVNSVHIVRVFDSISTADRKQKADIKFNIVAVGLTD
jgi:hypothetical protein